MMINESNNFNFNLEQVSSASYDLQRYWQLCLSRGLKFHSSRNWLSDTEHARVVTTLDAWGSCLHQTWSAEDYDPRWCRGLWETDNSLLYMEASFGDIPSWHVNGAGDRDELAALWQQLDELLPEPVLPDDLTVSLTYYMQQPNGSVHAHQRYIQANAWEQVAPNYPARVGEVLRLAIDGQPPDSGGKLVLFHGPPGTGKSHFIRALIRSWRPWCSSYYICDPENFFGNASYMMEVMLNAGRTEEWRLFIVEDCDELVKADAKARTGQGLQRLLNLTDGLIGQGLRVIMLLTTNEPINVLHPAVIRKGRCLMNINFPLFSPPEASEWLRARGGRPESQEEMTLADMYEVITPHQLLHYPQTPAPGQYL